MEKKADKALKDLKKALPTKSAAEIKAKSVQGDRYLKKISPWHDEILKRVALKGDKPGQIERDLGIAMGWVSKIINSDAGKKRMLELIERADVEIVKKKVALLANRALAVLNEILESDDPEILTIKARVAQDLLDRAGVNEPKEHRVTYDHIFKTIRNSIESMSKEMEAKDKDRSANA